MTSSADDYDLSRLHPAAADAVREAIELGWRATQQNSGAIILYSPDRENRQELVIPPIRQYNDRKLKGLVEKIHRYSDAEDLALLKIRREAETERHAAQSAQEQAQEVARLEARARNAREAQEAADQASVDAEPHVLSAHPWVVRQGSVRMDGTLRVYDSRQVTQRNWSNDTVDFICTGTGCNQKSTNPASIQVHYSKSQRYDSANHPRLEHNDTLGLVREIPFEQYTSYTPHRSRVHVPKDLPIAAELTPQPSTPEPTPQQYSIDVEDDIQELLSKLSDLLIERALDGLGDRETELVADLDELRAKHAVELAAKDEQISKITRSRDSWKQKHTQLLQGMNTADIDEED